jgi:hypothetical protein
MSQHVKTTTRAVYLITSAQAADPASALALAQTGTLVPAKTTKVETKRVRDRKPKPGAKPSAPRLFVQRVTVTTITVHSIADADAADRATAEAIVSSGKVTPSQQITHVAAARIPLRPPRVKKPALGGKTAPHPASQPNPLPPLKVTLERTPAAPPVSPA